MIQILLLLLSLIFAGPAHAQCNGSFGANQVCGRGNTAGPPGPVAIGSFNLLPVYNVNALGMTPDGQDRSTTLQSIVNTACATPPTAGGVIAFPATLPTSITTTTSAVYSSGGGTLTATVPASSFTIPAGNLVTLNSFTGTASASSLNGTYTVQSNVGTTLVVNVMTGLPASTITSGLIVVTPVYRADSAITIPNDSAAPIPHQCNLTFAGSGGGINWQSQVPGVTINSTAYGNSPNSSILDLRFHSTNSRLNGPGYTAYTPQANQGLSSFISTPLIAGTCTATTSGTTLTTSACASGAFAIGQTVVGATIALTEGTKITGGSNPNWTINNSQNTGSQTVYGLTGGVSYAKNDQTFLLQSGGTQISSASIFAGEVDNNGAILNYFIGIADVRFSPAGGQFSVSPTSFSQGSSSGGGSGVVINNPTYTGYTPKMSLVGAGAFNIDGMQIVDLSGSNITPFFGVSNTNINAKNSSFICSANATQDVFLLGGDQEGIGSETNGPFQGYGSQIVHNYFSGCNRSIWARQVANNWTFAYNVITNPTGPWEVECNANFTAVGRAGGDQNIGAIVENNLSEGLGGSGRTVNFWAEINGCVNGLYSNNTMYDAGNYLYHPWAGAQGNMFVIPQATGTIPVQGGPTEVLTSKIVIPGVGGIKTSTGFGAGEEVYSEFLVKGGYSAPSTSNYPGGLVVNNGTVPNQYASLGITSGHGGVSNSRAELDSNTLVGAAGAGPQELVLNPSGGQVSPYGPLGHVNVKLRTATTSVDAVSQNADYFVCPANSSTAATETLPTSPIILGFTLHFKDCGGNAGTHTITISPSIGLIDGATTLIMSASHQAVDITWDGSNWQVN